jgi:hypothetical protein
MFWPTPTNAAKRDKSHFARQKLQGDASSEREILGLIDNSHAATAKLANDFVVRDG